MRPEKQGSDRAKLAVLAVGVLEEAIAEDAFVRVIDLFVDQLGDLTKLGFSLPPERPREKGGAAAYGGHVFLKFSPCKNKAIPTDYQEPPLAPTKTGIPERFPSPRCRPFQTAK